MKYSRQREAVLQVVQMSDDHPNAEQIYDRVKKKLPNISLGTVYRNLNQLSLEQQIKKIEMPNLCDCFDKTIEDHIHMYCRVCKKTFDVEEQIEIKRLQTKIPHQIEKCDIVLLGICNHCLPKIRKKEC